MKKVAADIYAAGYIILVLVQVSFSTQWKNMIWFIIYVKYLWALVIGSEPNTALGKLGQKANDEKNVLNRFESNTSKLSLF
jgi:hypothetical protein